MSFISLPTGKIHEEKNTKKIKNFPTGYVGKFLRNSAGNVNGVATSEFYSRIANDVDIPSSDVQNYLLATSNFSKSMQNDIIIM